MSGKTIDLANEVKSGSHTTVVYSRHNIVSRHHCVCVAAGLSVDIICA